MMKEAIRALETGALAEVGLIAFVLAFVLVLAYALTLPKASRERLGRLPLEDDEVTPPTPSRAEA
jgi:hypothetical protein